MKSPLREFVDWLENAHLHGRPCGSPFEQAVPPHTLIWAERALDLALASGRIVLLFTRSTPTRSVIAGLAFHRADVKIEEVYRGDLDDDGFDRLTGCVAQMKTTTLVFEEGFPTTPDSVAGRVAEGSFVLIC